MAEDAVVPSNVDFLTGRWWENSSLRLDQASGVIVWTGLGPERRFALPGSPAVGLPALAAVVVTESFHWFRGKYGDRHQETNKLFLPVDSDGRARWPAAVRSMAIRSVLAAACAADRAGLGRRVTRADRPSWPADLDRLYPGAGALANATPPAARAVLIAIVVVIHGYDIAWPTNRTIEVPTAALVIFANACRRATPFLHAKQRCTGLTLRAQDIACSAGAGLEVTGPLASIIMAIAGRTSALDDLSGAGRDTLCSRV